MEPQTKVVTLLCRVTGKDGAKTQHVTMREPLVRDHIDASRHGKETAEIEVHLLAALCDVPVKSVMGMRMRDYQLLQEAYGELTLGKGESSTQGSSGEPSS